MTPHFPDPARGSLAEPATPGPAVPPALHGAPAPWDTGWDHRARLARLTAAEPDVREAVVGAGDGLVLAVAPGTPRDRADQLAALASGLCSLAAGACTLFRGGQGVQVVVEMAGGVLFTSLLRCGACVILVAAPGCDVARIGYALSTYAESTPGHPG
ncbi:roadblock/LC7 domain-containing protein [Streptomyces sp. NPDC090021]|uniref:roadblock/LC7 domain-containing protein n=1 Tax=Streptomyces sp. NPDC090021 TaxID=3365919 RepID=UPI00382E9215